MAQLRQDHEEFEKRNTKVLIIGPDSVQKFARYWQEHELPFIGLPDPDHKVLKLYGQEINLFKLGRMPAQILVDEQGTARYVHYGHSMSDIPENSELLELIDSL